MSTPTDPARPPTAPDAAVAPTDQARPPTLPGAVGILLAAGAGRRMGRPKALVVGDDGEPWLTRGVRVLREAGCAEIIVVLGAEAARARALLAGPEVVTAPPPMVSPASTLTTSTAAMTHAPTVTTPASAPASGPGTTSSAATLPTTSAPTTSTASRVAVVDAADWREGIGASLRAGIAAVANGHRHGHGHGHGDVVIDENGTGDAAATFAVVTLVDLPELRAEAIRRLAAGATESSLRQAAYGGRPGHPVVIGAAHFAALGASLRGDVGARPYLLAHGVEAVDCTDLGGGDDMDSPPFSAG